MEMAALAKDKQADVLPSGKRRKQKPGRPRGGSCLEGEKGAWKEGTADERVKG
jgi:hypothetical protein